MTIGSVLHESKKLLQSPTPRLDAEVLLAFALQKDRSYLHAHEDEQLGEPEYVAYASYITRRMQNEPIAYITGKQEFYGREFLVNKNVLVPRPESESFLELLSMLRETERIHTLLDIGTGSGILAITIKREFSDLYVTATDISSKVLKIAAQNALKHSAAIVFKKQSLLTGDKEGYDVVVANLPYVPVTMNHESISQEPPTALYSGTDGLDHYRELFAQLAPKHIRFVLTESLTSQHKEVKKIAARAHYKLHQTAGLVQLFYKVTDVSSLQEQR